MVIEPQAQKVADSNTIFISETLAIAMIVLTHFERKGFNPDLLSIVIGGVGDEFYSEFLQVLLARQRFQTIL